MTGPRSYPRAERVRAAIKEVLAAEVERLRDPGLGFITITDVTMCLSCIARKTGVPVEQVNGLLRTITRTLRLRIGPHRCDACLQHKTTFSVAKDGHP